MFYTTLRYVFLDLEVCLVEVPPIITLISPSGSCDNSSTFPFNLSPLWSHPRKFLYFPYLMRFFICCFKSKHSFTSCPWSLCKWQYLFLAAILIPIVLIGISFHFFQPLQKWIILDLHKHLFKWHVQGCILLTPCWRTCLLVVSIFLLSHPGLLWTRTLLRMAREIYFHSLGSLPLLSYDFVLCIHEVLGRMDEFSHGLRLLLIKLMDE